MTLFLSILTIAVLSIIIYQDFKFRGIWFLTLPVLFIVIGCNGYFTIGLENILMNVLTNFLIVVLIFVLLIVYFYVRKRSIKQLFRIYLGVGDVGFLISITPAFSTLNYLLFLTMGFTLGLVTWLIVCLVKKDFTLKAPLAGLLAIFLVLTIIAVLLKGYNLYNDNIVFESIYNLTID